MGRRKRKVRQKFCSPEYDFDSKARFQKILDLFDSVKSKKDFGQEEPQGPAFKTRTQLLYFVICLNE